MKKFMKLEWCYWMTLSASFLLAACASPQKNAERQIISIMAKGNCSEAESKARANFEGGNLYYLLSVIEKDCNKNNNKSLEYAVISAKLGNKSAISMLQKHGYDFAKVEVPPAPPVKINVNPSVQPVQPSSSGRGAYEECFIFNKDLIQCGNRQCFNMGGIIQCQ